MLRFVLAGAMALAAASCAWDNSTQLSKPVDGYPCGVAGVVCYGADLKPTGQCCYQGSVCGGAFPNIGCPAGECCAEGLDGVSRDGSGRPPPVAPPRPQWSAR